MNQAQPKISVAPADLRRLSQSASVELLDVRTPPEFAAAHVPGAVSAPLDNLDPAAFLKSRGTPGKPIYVLCQSGGRARKAIERFERTGFHDCVLVEGGTQAWIDAGLPVIRGRSNTLPLMRQVQIVVGIISAIGAVLALAVNPLFAILPLLIGCGLLFAGLTGICGLALLLTKMPWNRAAASTPTTCCETKNL